MNYPASGDHTQIDQSLPHQARLNTHSNYAPLRTEKEGLLEDLSSQKVGKDSANSETVANLIQSIAMGILLTCHAQTALASNVASVFALLLTLAKLKGSKTTSGSLLLRSSLLLLSVYQVTAASGTCLLGAAGMPVSFALV